MCRWLAVAALISCANGLLLPTGLRTPLGHQRTAAAAACAEPAERAEVAIEPEPEDADIIQLTDANGVNKLIGRKIETPADWLEVRPCVS